MITSILNFVKCLYSEAYHDKGMRPLDANQLFHPKRKIFELEKRLMADAPSICLAPGSYSGSSSASRTTDTLITLIGPQIGRPPDRHNSIVLAARTNRLGIKRVRFCLKVYSFDYPEVMSG